MAHFRKCLVFVLTLYLGSCASEPQRSGTPQSNDAASVASDVHQPSSAESNRNAQVADTAPVSGALRFAKASTATACKQQLASATWQSTTLYDLTYQCKPRGWASFLKRAEVKAEIKSISDQLTGIVNQGKEINPDIGNVFRAMYVVSPSEITAVIVGQDPAPTKGQATGLAFSLRPGVPASTVPSVQRVMLEAKNEGYCMNLADGNLSAWADQGVLLLNTALTIPCPTDQNSCQINGHKVLWAKFTGLLIDQLEMSERPFTYILWGNQAGGYAKSVENPKHKVLKGGHPSPLAAAKNFFCKNYFECTNKWLLDNGDEAVNWATYNQCESQPPCLWSKGKDPKCVSPCTLSTCN